MTKSALQRLVEQLPGRDRDWQARMQALVATSSPDQALEALREHGFLPRWQPVAQAARNQARLGDAGALAIALDWLDELTPGWVERETALGGALVSNAVAGDTMATLDVLLARGIKAESGEGGKTALHQAIALPGPGMLARLLALGVREYGCDDDGLGLLHRVAQGSNAAMARLLVEAGWDVNAPDETARRQSPLAHAATRGQDIGMFSALLWLGANARQTDAQGMDVVAMLGNMDGAGEAFAARALAEIERVSLEMATAQAQGDGRRAERL